MELEGVLEGGGDAVAVWTDPKATVFIELFIRLYVLMCMLMYWEKKGKPERDVV